MEELEYRGLLFSHQKRQQSENLEELFNALKLYLQSGIENQLLRNLIYSEALIENNYKKLHEEVKLILKEDNSAVEETQKKIFKCMDEVSYLSQLRRIISMYNLEYRKREEKKQFQYYSQESRNLPVIVKAVVKGNVSPQTLEKTEGIKAKSVYSIVQKYPELFTESERNTQIFFSLSHKGNRYYDFVSVPQMQDTEVCQKLIYNNCHSIMKSLGSFVQSEVMTPKPLKLVDLGIMQEKALRQQYRMLTQEISIIKKRNMPLYCATQVLDIKVPQHGYYLNRGGKNERISIKVKNQTRGE